MRVSVIALTLFVALSATAVAQQPVALGVPRGPVDVVLDFKNRLALVPEGTVVPAGLKFSAQWSTRRSVAGRGQRPPADAFRQAPDEEKESVSFVFAYAPQSFFEPYRAANRTAPNASSRRIQPLVFSCYGPYTVYASHPDCSSCYITLVHNFCTDNFSFFQPYTEYYYADLTMAATPAWAYTTIGSDDGYFSCSQYSNYSADPLSCYASDLRYNTDPVVGTTVRIDGAAEYWLWGDVYGVYVSGSWSPYSRHQN